MFTRNTVILKNDNEVWGNSKTLCAIFRLHLKSQRLDLCGARRNVLSTGDEMYIKKLNFGILEYLRITPLSSMVKTPVQQSTI